jgi:peroxidase
VLGYVQGCDGSVLLAGPNSERAATINNRLHGFEIIDQIKAAVEKACPRTVSCADILQYAARDSVVVTGGSSWKVYAGRRDGRVSNVDEPAQNLPTGFSLAGELVSTFEQQGLSPSQMVDLSGAHTIGLTHCDHISNRIYKPVDPTMPKDLLKKFQNTCPKATTNTPIVLDQKSVSKFDTAYFKNIQKGRGVMTSDQELYNPDAYLSRYVDKNTNQDTFVHRFGAAMIAMGSIQVTVAPDGEIRKRCQYVN